MQDSTQRSVKFDKATECLQAERFGLCSTLLQTFLTFSTVQTILGLPLDLIFKTKAVFQKLVTNLTVLF